MYEYDTLLYRICYTTACIPHHRDEVIYNIDTDVASKRNVQRTLLSPRIRNQQALDRYDESA